MQYRRLGNSGLKVSAVSLGSWRTFGHTVDQATTEACMVAAYEAGINFFDGAEAYARGAAEKAMGEVFRAKKWPRDTLVISSKVIRIGDKANQSGLSRKHLVEACDAALQRMGLDYLDLFFCHRPDPETPMEETVRTMHELILRGKILYWGTSMFSGPELMEAYAIANRYNLTPPTMEQTVYNMLERERMDKELQVPLTRFGLGTTVYSPMAVGFLSGKYNEGIPEGSHASANTDPAWRDRFLAEAKIAKSRKLAVIAKELGIPQARLALAWCLRNPHVSTVITGSSRPEQVVENAKAADDVALLTDEIMQRIAEIITA
jgi:voltage-dependent potassium channel beta subunit